jgi:hypothetical protein
MFRMSKTDLRIRPIYHRLRHRIEAHICVSFTAYAIYKELERVLHANKSDISINRARELSHNMYQITYLQPESKQNQNGHAPDEPGASRAVPAGERKFLGCCKSENRSLNNEYSHFFIQRVGLPSMFEEF